jgi:hypothetical protein
LKLPNS